jgi:adiponectin receptor
MRPLTRSKRIPATYGHEKDGGCDHGSIAFLARNPVVASGQSLHPCKLSGPSHSLRKSLSSLFYLHTEFVNIHTHLVGALVLALIGFPVYRSISLRYESFSWKDGLAFGIWFLCAILCLAMSATYHTICNHSPGYNAFSQKLDHLGITILTSGSFLSMIYYGWYFEPQLAYTFSTMA